MTGICVRTLSVAATALLPLGQPLRLVLSGDTKDPSDLWVRVAARLLEFNRSKPDLGGAAVAGHMHVGPLLAVAHAKPEDEPGFLPKRRHLLLPSTTERSSLYDRLIMAARPRHASWRPGGSSRPLSRRVRVPLQPALLPDGWVRHPARPRRRPAERALTQIPSTRFASSPLSPATNRTI